MGRRQNRVDISNTRLLVRLHDSYPCQGSCKLACSRKSLWTLVEDCTSCVHTLLSFQTASSTVCTYGGNLDGIDMGGGRAASRLLSVVLSARRKLFNLYKLHGICIGICKHVTDICRAVGLRGELNALQCAFVPRETLLLRYCRCQRRIWCGRPEMGCIEALRKGCGRGRLACGHLRGLLSSW